MTLPKPRDTSQLSVDTCRARLLAKSEWQDECLVWTGGRTRQGYGHLLLDRYGNSGRNKGAWSARAHQVAWFVATGEWPHLNVLHRCDNPPCFNIDHLFLGTVADNVRDMDQKGRRITVRQLGPTNGSARLTEDAVRELRQRMADGEPRKVVAADFGICETTVHDVIHGHTWMTPEAIPPGWAPVPTMRPDERPLKLWCANGHEYTPENTSYNTKRRRCRLCIRDAYRRWRARSKAARQAAS